jgi:hypothetical protein
MLVNGQLESRFSLDVSQNKVFTSVSEKDFNENQKIKLIIKSEYSFILQKEEILVFIKLFSLFYRTEI